MCKHKYGKVGHSVNTFTINQQTFSIRLSDHATLRLKQRNIDQFQAIGAILSLGENRILEYKDSNKDIMLFDKVNNFAIVFAVEGNTIYIITVIDSTDLWVKKGTTVVNL